MPLTKTEKSNLIKPRRAASPLLRYDKAIRPLVKKPMVVNPDMVVTVGLLMDIRDELKEIKTILSKIR